MQEIEARVNKEAGGSKCYKFDEHEKNFDKVCAICEKCKFLDTKSDFPNRFCDKNCEMIDFWFCTPECPLGKFKLVDKQEKILEVNDDLRNS